MNKKDFVTEYNIRDAVPLDPSSRVLPAEGFALAIEEFINEKFRGAARAHSRVSSYGGVLVSAEYAAFFFKTLLAEIYGRCFLEINLTSDNDKLTILIEADGALPLTDSQMRNLIKIARNAGMKIEVEEQAIRLSLLFSDAAIRRVYAISVNDGRGIMAGKLQEIFYCGELYQCEDKPSSSTHAEPKKKSAKK